MPLEKRSGTASAPAEKRDRWRCQATGENGPCGLTRLGSHTGYCEWHEYVVRTRGAYGLSFQEFDTWLGRRDPRDWRWKLNTPAEFWDLVNGRPAPPPGCHVCHTPVKQGDNLVPDPRGPYCSSCWPGPPPRQRKKEDKHGQENHPKRAAGGGGLDHLADIAAQHKPPADEEEIPF